MLSVFGNDGKYGLNEEVPLNNLNVESTSPTNKEELRDFLNQIDNKTNEYKKNLESLQSKHGEQKPSNELLDDDLKKITDDAMKVNLKEIIYGRVNEGVGKTPPNFNCIIQTVEMQQFLEVVSLRDSNDPIPLKWKDGSGNDASSPSANNEFGSHASLNDKEDLIKFD